MKPGNQKFGQMGRYFIVLIQGYKFNDNLKALDFEIRTKGAQETAEKIYTHVLTPLGW